jgi:PAS domain S-box-containing protein
VVLTNRGLALFAIWVTAFLIASRKKYEDQLVDARDTLEEQVVARTRELSGKNALVDLLHRVAVAANRAKEVDAAMQVCLDEICAYTGWPTGHVYMLASGPPPRMVPTTIWHIDDEVRFGAFKEVTERSEFAPGVGLPGRVLESGEALWIRDVSQDPNFPRAKFSDDIVAHTGFGLPVKVGEDVVAMLEFYATEVNEPDESLLRVVDNIGTQLGRVIERSRTEVDLRKLSRAIEQSPSMMHITDTEGIIEYCNPKFLEFMGLEPADVIGENPRIFQSGETPPEVYEDLWRTIKSGADWQGGMQNRRRNGDAFWTSLTVSPVTDETGQITNFVAAYEDLTERRESERSLRQVQKMESLGSLAGGMAHDINNMLVPIMNVTASTIDSLPQERPERANLGLVMKAADQVRSLVAKILEFSRQDKAEMVALDVSEAVAEAVALIQSTMPSTITLNLKLDGDVGMIVGDRSQITSAIINLSSNAIDAMEGKTGRLGFSLAVANVDRAEARKISNIEAGDFARIGISDTGIGMKEEILHRVLDPFFTTKDVGRGTGMGLAMVYGIVSNHGGAIDIASTPGDGTTVTMYLPLVGERGEAASLVMGQGSGESR